MVNSIQNNAGTTQYLSKFRDRSNAITGSYSLRSLLLQGYAILTHFLKKDITMEGMLTIEMVAQKFNVSTRTVARMVEKGQLRALRVGRQWRFEQAWIDQWIAAHATQVKEDIG